MNILVTGGSGFIGVNLVNKLVKLGHNVTVIDNYHTSPDNIYIRNKKVEYICINVWDIEDLLPRNGKVYDLCFHLAALSRIQPSFANPKAFFCTNTIGTQAVCDWAKKYKVKVIYSGSSSQWKDPLLSPYACYKKMGEDICKLYKNIYGCNIEIARLYNVYGKYEIKFGEWSALIGKWRGLIYSQKPITIVADGNQKRDFTHVNDIVDGLIRIAFSHQKHKDAWELGSGFQYSINEVSKMFVDKFKCKVKYIDNQLGNYSDSIRANDDAITRLGWKPKDRLKKYIKNL